MIQISEKAFFIFITIIFVFILLMTFGLMGLFYLYLKKQKEERKKSLPSGAISIPSSFCHHHEKILAVGTCLICEESFCKDCLKEIDGLHFCPEDVSIYTKHTWKKVTNQKTTPENTKDALYIYEYKKNIWKKERVPSYILTHYKINIEGDFIESYVELYFPEDIADYHKNQLTEFSLSH